MYRAQKDSVSPREHKGFWPSIPGLQNTCGHCWDFYIAQRDDLNKSVGVGYGKVFEDEFMKFLKAKGIDSEEGDDQNMNYPDIRVLKRNGKPACYLELKYLTAPFLTVRKKVDPNRDCYEGSATLDCDEKLLAQRRFVEHEIPEQVYYVYWLDYPCIKGIFYWEAESVYAYVDSVGGLEFTRKTREGDFAETYGGMRKVGHIDKVYVPLLQMKSFRQLMDELGGRAV
jgi:hypothetical protein